MFTVKNTLAAMLTCCGIAGAWYLAEHANDHAVAKNVSVRKDTFATSIGNKLASIAKTSENHTHTVIFDNDAATDDALALILIGNDPGVTLKAITVSGTGEAHGRQGAENMAAIASMLGKSDVPVAYGHARPLSSAGKPFPGFVRDKVDKLLVGTHIKARPGRITDNAVGLMKQVVENSRDKVTILATGPLTNIAEFVTQYPSLKNKIDRIIIMGGAVNVPGNIDDVFPEANNKVSEWNFYADPVAVKRVFAAKIPVTLIALDATNQVPLTRKFLAAIAREDQPGLRLTHKLLKNWAELMGEERFFSNIYLWDGLAAMILLDPAMAETQSMPLVVDVTNGQVKLAAKGQRHAAKIDVVTKILQPEAVLSNFVATIKSNHIFAQRQFHYNVGRVTAYLGRAENGLSTAEKEF